MEELRVVRREDTSLVLESETGEEYRLVVDSELLTDLRHLARQLGGGQRVNPRQIQSLVRAGKTRAEIAEITGADEADIDRYEEPVLAERRFILSSAQAVQVRTTPAEQEEQQFGAVIAERLIGLDAQQIEWNSWRDEEAGWMIGLDFMSRDVAHRAVWSFDHRKSLLSPITPDAVSLSKQGDLGDRLIPKLRAVDNGDTSGRFDSGAFDPATIEPVELSPVPANEVEDAPRPVSPGTEAAFKAGHPSTGSIPIIDVDAEFARRREIDQRAIKTTEPELPDLGQTADLLEALRRRRGEREAATTEPAAFYGEVFEPAPEPDNSAPVSLHAVDSPEPAAHEVTVETSDAEAEKPEPTRRGRGRTSIPSWDDILFGTRGEGDDN